MKITAAFLRGFGTTFDEESIKTFETSHPDGLISDFRALREAAEKAVGFNVWLLWKILPAVAIHDRFGGTIEAHYTPATKSDLNKHIEILSNMLETEYP